MNELWIAAVLTFAASAHCLGMCGGLMVTVAARGKRPGALRDFLLLQLGKGTTYAFLGALAGLFGAAVTGSAAFVWSTRILTFVAALALAIAGLTLLGLRRGAEGAWGKASLPCGAACSVRFSRPGPPASRWWSVSPWASSPALSSTRASPPRRSRRAPAWARSPSRASPSVRSPPSPWPRRPRTSRLSENARHGEARSPAPRALS